MLNLRSQTNADSEKIDASVLFVSTSDSGGAGLAAARTYTALKPRLKKADFIGSKVQHLRAIRQLPPSTSHKVLLRVLNYFESKFIQTDDYKEYDIFSNGIIGHDISELCYPYDIVQLFWICGLLPINKIKNIGKPVVWRFSDLWPITYGFHYDRLLIELGDWRDYRRILSYPCRKILDWKLNLLPKDVIIVCPSIWLKNLVLSSEYFSADRVLHVPTGVDTDLYMPLDKDLARNVLGLQRDSIIFLIGAQGGDKDSRKGFDRIRSITNALKLLDSRVVVIGFGGRGYDEEDIQWFGHIYSERVLSVLFSASNLYIHGALYDNFPQTVLEAQSCGTPVAAFDSTGVSEAILDGITGLKLVAADTDVKIARKILAFATKSACNLEVDNNVREHILRNYNIIDYAGRMGNIYRGFKLVQT